MFGELRNRCAGRPRAWRALPAFAALCALGCGSGATRSAPLEFTPRHAQLFDDGIDLIDNPDGLSGRWRSDWEADVDGRITEADWVAIGKVVSVQVEVDPERRASYRVVLQLGRTLKGSPPKRDVTLASREGASGYASLEQHREHILQREFVAFVRYAQTPETGRVAHFHLMPPSPGLTRAVERYDARQNPHRIQVIEHRHEE